MERLIKRARENQLFRGLMVGEMMTLRNLSTYFLANGTVFYYKPKAQFLLNIRCAPKVKIIESELVQVGERRDLTNLARILGCNMIDHPIRL